MLRAPSSFRGPGSARPWLFGIARRQAARTWRRRVGEPRELLPLGLPDAGEGHGADLLELGLRAGWGEAEDPEALLSLHEREAQLRRAMDALGAADREVIVLRDLEGLSGPEVAALLGIGLPALKTRLHRARLRLLAQLRAAPRAVEARP